MFIPLRDTNPALRTPYVTYGLIAANTLVFFLGFLFPFDSWVFSKDAFLNMEPLGFSGLISYQFLHGGWGHILFNMLFLYIFGDNMESSLGHRMFLLFYLACGVGAALFEVYVDPYFGAAGPGLLIGASGSVSGVLAAYAIRYPRAKLLTWTFFIFFIKVPAIIFIGIWITLQFFYQFMTPGATTAYIAHIGGFVTGLVFYSIYHRSQLSRYHDQ
jgi:membrane associated rhomboid family serine protease